MRTYRTIILAMTLCVASASHGQAWSFNPPGNLILGNEYLGAAAGSTQPLRLTTIPNLAIEFRTNDLLRMRLNETTSYTIGAFGAQVKNGALGLSPNNTLWANGPGPFSRLHLHDGTTSVLQAPYRPWMDNGITFTTNSDQMYIGHKVEPGFDQTAAVIQWADNEFPAAGPDVLKFLFTASYSPLGTGPNSLNGREIARMHPRGFLGIGDWQAAGLQPEERLDVLDGRVRIRQLPTEPAATTVNKFMVVDDDGLVKWRPAPGGGGGCEWNQFGGADHLRTAWSGAAPGCPNENSHVGIGTGSPSAKLTVEETATQPSAAESAVQVRMFGDSDTNYGMDLTVTNATGATADFNRGIRAYVDNSAVQTIGIESEVRLTTGLVMSEDLIGVNVRPHNMGTVRNLMGTRNYLSMPGGAHATGQVFGSYNYVDYGGTVEETREVVGVFGGIRTNAVGSRRAIWGKIYGANSNNNDWAAFFEGEGFLSASLWQYSDQNLKVDVASLENCLEVVGQLEPKQFRFDPENHPGLGLPDDLQPGLIAQDLAGVLPHLVRTVSHSAEYDSLGTLISEGGEYLAVNYIGIIPYLAGAIRESHTIVQETQAVNAGLLAEVNELRSRLDQMEQVLSTCCAAGSPTAPNDVFDGHGAKALDPALERLLAIAPNPFPDHTTVYYILERPGRVQLLVNSADGRHVQVLHEGVLPAGEHRYEWSTGHLAPGVHYVTLLLDGEPLVKRAVKL